MALLEAVAAQAQTLEVGLYAVGGFVRDLLLGLANLDVDLVVEGDAIRLAQTLVERYGGKLHDHTRFGTAKWLLDADVAEAVEARLTGWPPFIDFVTARTEFYEQPTALPTVEQRSIKLDLHRRDFTINTLAIRLSPPPFGELLDFYGGERDLRQGVIQVLHSLSFVDDPTRVLRAARFEQRLNFRIEPRTEALIHDALPFLHRLSGDRLRHELDLILREAQPEKALARLDNLGVIAAIDDGLMFDEWIAAAFGAARERLAHPNWDVPALDRCAVYWIILACRLADPAALAARLHLSRELATLIEQGHSLYQAMPDLERPQPASAVTRRLDGFGDETLLAGLVMTTSELAQEHIFCYSRRWRYVRATLNGHDLRAMGLKSGPLMGQLLARLRDAWLDGMIANPAQERETLQKWIAEAGEKTDNDGH
jgi:tRNA nucleotidyltransferase (CCA-adding enzyme)